MSKGISSLFNGTVGVDKALIQEAQIRGDKITESDVIGITRNSNGDIVWLEKGHIGNKPSGLAHILEEHEIDFNNKGINTSDIPNFILIAVSDGKIVGYQGKNRSRPIYEVVYNGNIHRVAVTIGSNGYIVGANPSKGD